MEAEFYFFEAVDASWNYNTNLTSHNLDISVSARRLLIVNLHLKNVFNENVALLLMLNVLVMQLQYMKIVTTVNIFIN